MGFITTFSIYNDGCDQIKTHSDEFAEKIYDACIGVYTRDNKTHQVGLGNHGNLITVQAPRHADAGTFYFHYGNFVWNVEEIEYGKDIEMIDKVIKNMNVTLKFLREKKKKLQSAKG